MRMLITGGAGFIGSNFVRWLLEGADCANRPTRVVVLDALTYAGNLANLKGLETRKEFRFERGNICDGKLVLDLLQQEGLDTIVNFAAETHVDRSIVDPSAFVRTNIEGTLVLLQQGRQAEIKRFLQISTDEVYGSLGPTGRFVETTPLDPTSPYAASKAAADLLVLSFHKTYQFPVVVTRCSNNYGPYQFPEKLIPLFITNALRDEPLPLYGDGKNVRSWLHTTDHSQAIMAVLERGRFGEVYNIGGAVDSEWENIRVTETILRLLDKPSSLVRRVADRLGHDRRYAIDYSKIQNELQWQPKIDFQAGLKQTVEWYRENISWWEAIKSGEYLNFYQLYYSDRLRHGKSTAV